MNVLDNLVGFSMFGRTMNKNLKAQRELSQVADQAAELFAQFTEEGARDVVARVTEICETVQKSWSGSNLGYHANVYFRNLDPIEPGAHFSPEWGIRDDSLGLGHGSDRRFLEYSPDKIKSYILTQAGNPDVKQLESAFDRANSAFGALRRDAVSILSAVKSDDFLTEVTKEIKELSVLQFQEARHALYPRGQRMSRDSLAVTQGTRLAPHQEIWADMLAISSARRVVENLMTLARQAAAHLGRISDEDAMPAASRRVFVGHGRSPVWRELKDFLRDTLGLDVEEFSQVPTAGISTTTRLFDMLDQCGFALLIMTAEDESSDGRKLARLNVIHEIGLFQGRLGASKAIVMLEDGCEEFSNIHGLGQIRFMPGNIRGSFEDVRSVLKREGIISR